MKMNYYSVEVGVLDNRSKYFLREDSAHDFKSAEEFLQQVIDNVKDVMETKADEYFVNIFTDRVARHDYEVEIEEDWMLIRIKFNLQDTAILNILDWIGEHDEHIQ